MYRRALIAATLAFAALGAHAADAAYPSKPIRIIVGYSPGGSNDVIARLIGKRLEDSMGQPVVVENRPSTGAIVGAVVAARAPADGYTLMVGATGPIVMNPATYRKLPYSPQKDFVPVSLLADFPLILSVRGDGPLRSVADLVKYTQANPDRSNYSASASAFQLASELLKARTGIAAEHVPYKGSADAIMAVASGEVTFTMADPGPAAGAIKGKLLRGLAVTSDRRMATYPDLPTLKEQGIDQQINFWIGLFAPAGTPAPIVERLQRETARAVADPATAQAMAQLGLNARASSSEAFAQLIDQEIKSWSALAQQKNIHSD